MPSSSSSRKDKPTSSALSKSSSGSKRKESSSSTSRTGMRRLMKELETWQSELKEERGIERLGPVGEDDMMRWEAVINGRGVGSGYDGRGKSSSCCPSEIKKRLMRAMNRRSMAHID